MMLNSESNVSLAPLDHFDEATGGIPTEGGGAISHYSWSVPNFPIEICPQFPHVRGVEILWSFFIASLALKVQDPADGVGWVDPMRLAPS